jgi:hypothetical protein
LALAHNNPLNLTNGARIDVSEALSHVNKKEFHHIYPRAFLKRNGVGPEENSLVNICMLAASENKVISDADPHKYLPTSIFLLGSNAQAVFKSNLMPNPETFDYNSASYSEFLEARSNLIAKFCEELCNGIVS